MKKNSIILLLFIIFIGTQFSTAQQVDIYNKVEYSSEESGVDDINSITIPAKKIKKNKNTDSGVSIEDLQRIVKKRNATRYRKVRKESEKCFKDVEEESCDDKESKLKIIKKDKK